MRLTWSLAALEDTSILAFPDVFFQQNFCFRGKLYTSLVQMDASSFTWITLSAFSATYFAFQSLPVEKDLQYRIFLL